MRYKIIIKQCNCKVIVIAKNPYEESIIRFCIKHDKKDHRFQTKPIDIEQKDV